MNRKLDSKKDMNEYKIVIPMSDETIKKIKENAAKAVLGASIAGVMIAGGQSVKAQSVQEPLAVRQTIDAQNESDKKELSLMIDEILTSNEKKTDTAEVNEVPAETMGADRNASSDETSNADKGASSDETLTQEDQADAASENNKDITLNDFINDDTLGELFDFNKIKADAEENLDVEEEKTPEAQKAPEKVTEPNYAEDEGKIKDYKDSKRYRETDLEPGSTNVDLVVTDENEEKDGFKFELKNPGKDSPIKTEYGYEITIDKKTGQRTYTLVYVTDSGKIPVNPGEKPMMKEGDKLTSESPEVTYKPNENTEVTKSGQQRNLNYYADEETLKHINNQNNDSTTFGFKDDYTQESPKDTFFKGNFSLGYKVNPWPNENDKLELMKLNGEYNEKVFVQGQDIDTGVKVDNMDASARERLVGQVYNPITGAIVPGARAYIADDGNIHIQMPKGALKQNEDGKYVVDKESIFNTKDYKALQHLDVKFFARPRTADEFKKIAQAPEDEWNRGTYVETGAGTADINHKGENVTIDKQGIDRYDHYNLIGNLKIKLDDTRYYDQRFEDGNNEDTSMITSSAVKPGEEFKVKIIQPNDPTETDKSALDMNKAESKGEAAGDIILDFINKANEGKADKDKWKLDVNPRDISQFTITPPKSAKAGDFVAVPVEYTYTNGSKDLHWFHFVVQESDNNKPEYHAEVGYKGDTLTQSPEIPNDEAATKKNQPKSYELVMPEDGSKYKDSAGNEWTDIKVDPNTGAVTATVPENADIKGGENLFVDVKVNYIDEKLAKQRKKL